MPNVPNFSSVPGSWGPSAWVFLHRMSFAYPAEPNDEEIVAAHQFFMSLQWLLPCAACAMHYAQILSHLPPDVRSRDSLSRWLVEVHNEVNASMGKPRMTYEAARTIHTALPPGMTL